MRRVKSRTPASSGVSLRKTFAGIIGQIKRRPHLRRIKNKLIRLDHFRRNRIAEHRGDFLPRRARVPARGDFARCTETRLCAMISSRLCTSWMLKKQS